MQNNNIRNFAIIAHIDHGKSTLADRLLELTGVVKPGNHDDQLLDRNPISRERGITIKLAPVRMEFPTFNSKLLTLNLIDTPGHVDFSYEVDRTLACVEGVVLLVDASQGIQAQTIANAYKAIDKNLTIIPVINKIDLPNAEITKTKKQLIDFLGVNDADIYEISAKTGLGVQNLLNAIIEKIPAPNINSQNTDTHLAKSLVFDSYYDQHQGVIAFVRVFVGQYKKGMKVKLIQTDVEFEVNEVGIFKPELSPTERLDNGEIGYIITNLKDIHDVRVGDTIANEKNISASLPGYKKVKPMVFASMFPTDTNDYLVFQKALEKLYLNDSALEYVPIYSKALGAGYRVGFLGLLHADVVRERLEREFGLSLILTPPQVEFIPSVTNKDSFEEPIVKIMILTPESTLGAVMQLCENYRAKFISMDNKNQISITYEMPLSEMITDFYDRLKSISAGYASLDWEFLRYNTVKASKLEVLLNGDPVEEFSEIVVQERSFDRSANLVKKFREVIPRQQYEVKVQARYKGKIIASERISPYRKNVLVKGGKLVGGGDYGRKRKLLEKQKEGKKKMKMIGKVEIPKEAFMKLFRK